MSIGARIREERLRLGASQPAFAALAGATKSAIVKWEKDDAAPNARTLAEWADVGADVLYILTGRRTIALPLDVAPYVNAQLAAIRRDVLEPARAAQPGESADQTEQRLMNWHANALSNILQHETPFLPQELTDQVAQLLHIVTDPIARDHYRAREFVTRRTKQREMRDRLAVYFDRSFSDSRVTILNLLARITQEYSVPIDILVELVQELRDLKVAE